MARRNQRHCSLLLDAKNTIAGDHEVVRSIGINLLVNSFDSLFVAQVFGQLSSLTQDINPFFCLGSQARAYHGLFIRSCVGVGTRMGRGDGMRVGT